MTTRRPKSLLATVLGVFLCFAAALVAGLAVCPKCGYEVDASAATCGHCQAELKPATAAADEKKPDATPTPEGHVFASSGKLEYLSPAAVTNEVKMGNDYVKKGAPDVARLFYLNALALWQLAKRDKDMGPADAILRLVEQAKTRGRLVEKECTVCGGSGKMRMKVVSLRGEVSYVDVQGKNCPRCSGVAKISVPSTILDWKTRMLKATEAFAVLQQGRRFVRVGEAWIPPDVDGKLTLRQAVALRQSTAMPCPDCAGTGRVDCKKCEGLGEIKCTNKDCQRGTVSVVAGGKMSEHKVVRTENCPVCEGNGALPCPDCKGEGTDLCKKCGGSGKRAACNKCGGEGLMECRRCQATGTYKDAVCPVCNGEKMALCSGCGGDGRKR